MQISEPVKFKLLIYC